MALGWSGVEYLRSASINMRDGTFVGGWATVAGVITVMYLANSLMLGLFFVEQPGLGLTLIRLIATIVAYPLVVVLAAHSLGMRKFAPGEVDHLGHRL